MNTLNNFSNLSDEQFDELYALRHIDAYEKLKDSTGWEVCMTCGVHPRVWAFNNGSYATCLCYRKYDNHPARSESVLSVYKRTGLTREYNPDNLRLAWNKFATTGEESNTLEEGMW